MTATGTAPLSYQWFGNLAPLAQRGNVSGATGAVLTLAPVTGSDVGNYTVVIANPFGSVTSPVATLTVVVPPQFSYLTLLPDKNSFLWLTAVSNLTYRIEASTDLSNWAALTNLPNPDGTIQFMDLDATNFSQRFYRAVWVP